MRVVTHYALKLLKTYYYFFYKSLNIASLLTIFVNACESQAQNLTTRYEYFIPFCKILQLLSIFSANFLNIFILTPNKEMNVTKSTINKVIF
jgi:hypothetical protein